MINGLNFTEQQCNSAVGCFQICTAGEVGDRLCEELVEFHQGEI